MHFPLFVTLGLLGIAAGVPFSMSATNRIAARDSAPGGCLAGYIPVSVEGKIACQSLDGPTSPQCPKGQTAVNVNNKPVCAPIQQ